MKKSLAIGASLVAGASATSVGATGTVPSPYFGSDTLASVTANAISGAGLGPSGAYVAGGSAAGVAAMANRTANSATQQTAPATKMLTSSACQFNLASGSAGTFTTNATGIVIGLDAIDVLASTTSGAASACNGTADQSGTGLAYSGSSVFGSGGNQSNSLQNWKYVLALVYGGKDVTTGVVDCNQTSRRNLVSNWSSLYQNGCANGNSVCSDSTHNSALWHAFRRDDGAGTSDVFSSLIGLSPSQSQSANNGFGTDPYCNALNWDTDANNNGTVKGPGATTNFCSFGAHDQWTGPGGIVDPNSACVIGSASSSCTTAGKGNHRRPPPGTWGDNPDSSQTTNSADVLPTDLQDNDPIRRPCIGNGQNATKSAEQTCNLDGALGLVQVIPDTQFIKDTLKLQQFPTTPCNGSFIFGNPVNVFNCAPFKTSVHSGECANGDALIGGGCLVPISSTSSQCLTNASISPTLTSRTLPNVDGRVYNVHLRDGDLNDGSCAYIEQTVQNGTATPLSRDFVGGGGRIHTQNTIFAGTSTSQVGCQLVATDDQIGCLVQADPCSIGFGGDGAKTWNQRANAGITNPSGTVTDAIRIDQVYPTQSSAQLLGVKTTATGIEYQFGRKLYFNSIVGFGNITAGGSGVTDPATGELTLAQYESVASDINPILSTAGFFTTGPQGGQLGAAGTGGTAASPFCEDFNQQLVCGSSSLGNDNACFRNPSTVANDIAAGSAAVASTVNSTICGNGIVEAFEECDPGASATAGTSTCSNTCRCAGRTSYEPNGSGGYACQ
jgi:hypothetical protein